MPPCSDCGQLPCQCRRNPSPKPPKAIARFALALVFALAGVVAVQSPAAASWAQCPVGTACMYIDVNGGGGPLIASVSGSGVNSCWNLSPSWNDKISSAFNRFAQGANIKLRMFVNSNCQGSNTTVYWGEKAEYTGIWNPYADGISSFALVSP